MSDSGLTLSGIERLLDLMARLRDPETGCPWDVKQDFSTIAPYTVEEAYEVMDAIEREDWDELRRELGDLLLQVVFHSRIAEERGLFRFGDVADAIADKLVRRHPHVFGETVFADESEQHAAWEAHKAVERSAAGAGHGALDGVAKSLPALPRAVKLQKRAARVGFDWRDPEPVIAKIHEELDEVRAEMVEGAPRERLEAEVGDLLFAVANLARHVGIDPEVALRGTNARFEGRFRYIEARLSEQGRRPEDCTLDELEALWVKAKRSGCR